jgi:F0F1-type ATP synthase membrane subunit b/b'
MNEPKRKEAAGKPRRSRGVLRRGSRGNDEKSQERVKPASKEEGRLDDSGKVSSLLETTSAEVKQLLEAADDAAEKIRAAARTEAADTSGGSPLEDDETVAMLGKINTEVRDVLESADTAAEKIRAEARAEARRLIEESRRRAESVTGEQIKRVTEITDQVLEELSGVRDQVGRLQAAFDASLRAMGADLGVVPAEVWETQQNGASEGEQEAAELRGRLGRRQGRKKAAAEPEGISEGARLLALQQHMAGVDAAVIEKRLREQFGIEDPRPVLEWMGLEVGESEGRRAPGKPGPKDSGKPGKPERPNASEKSEGRGKPDASEKPEPSAKSATSEKPEPEKSQKR